ncbi:MAG: Asp-tRNA(Asn)/Glu-tRNA(Gln) amidotransferase GatCAB subunit B, partial [Candidatus Helarchaeota archaeon]|nr:Asp-tRNA(Asn)/Glu-tRNA(Gln) amidotransferase GatCAB subunit B [Candidatus Helarchaeota archaeon]
ISGKMAKEIFEYMTLTGKSAEEIIKEKGLIQITDVEQISKTIDDVLKENNNEVLAYINGKEKLFGFFVGQVMKATKGKANPKIVNEELRKKLNSLKQI